jgi:MFS superfamily sulfate permease-like transporter
MIPVFGLAALPILWRRSNILAAIGVSFVITAASVPMFGWVVRCGWALPLSIAMAYAVARFAGSKQNHVIGLVGILALQIVALVKDSATDGLGALALSLPVAAVFYGIGLFVQSRSEKQPAGSSVDREHVPA